MATITRNTCRSLFVSCRNSYSKYHIKTTVRTILSEAYSCQDVWAQRLQTPTLKQIDAEDFALKLKEKFDREGSVDPIDIDILANKLQFIPKIQLDYAQSLLYRFRHTSSAVNVRDSTHHAIIRSLHQLKEHDRLMEILKDKIHYGVFLDNFTANILMDHYLKQDRYAEASEVAFDMMLQEDLSHPITRLLAWYSCHLMWKTLDSQGAIEVTEDAAAADVDDDEEEEHIVRVKFIENPWYDDHFDIPKVTQRLGKTLTMVTAGQEGPLGQSYQLLGWGLYEKFDKGLDLMKQWAESDEKGIVCEKALEDFGHRLESLVTKEPPDVAKDPGLVTLEDVLPYVTEQEKTLYLVQYREHLELLQKLDKVIPSFDLESELLNVVESTVQEMEELDIKQQTELFNSWNTEREDLVRKQVQDYKETKLKEALEKRLRALQEKEEKLTFFDNKSQVILKARLGKKKKEVDDFFESEEMQHWAPRT